MSTTLPVKTEHVGPRYLCGRRASYCLLLPPTALRHPRPRRKRRKSSVSSDSGRDSQEAFLSVWCLTADAGKTFEAKEKQVVILLFRMDVRFKSRECLQLLTQYCRSWEFILKNVKHYVVLQVIISYIADIICKMEKKSPEIIRVSNIGTGINGLS